MHDTFRIRGAVAAAALLLAGAAALAAAPADPRTVPSAAQPAVKPPVKQSALTAVQGRQLLGLLEQLGPPCWNDKKEFICVPTKGRGMIHPTILQMPLTPQGFPDDKLFAGDAALGIRLLACQLLEFRESAVCRPASAPKK